MKIQWLMYRFLYEFQNGVADMNLLQFLQIIKKHTNCSIAVIYDLFLLFHKTPDCDLHYLSDLEIDTFERDTDEGSGFPSNRNFLWKLFKYCCLPLSCLCLAQDFCYCTLHNSSFKELFSKYLQCQYAKYPLALKKANSL